MSTRCIQHVAVSAKMLLRDQIVEHCGSAIDRPLHFVTVLNLNHSCSRRLTLPDPAGHVKLLRYDLAFHPIGERQALCFIGVIASDTGASTYKNRSCRSSGY